MVLMICLRGANLKLKRIILGKQIATYHRIANENLREGRAGRFVYIGASGPCAVDVEERWTIHMGKSDKKGKAESINKLRKQYDAFLEEDRKRKERNEDILSKLDKMRSTVTRYKSNIYNDQRPPTVSFSEMPTNIIRYEPQIPMQVDIRSNHADESYLLSQISKKYILIPKSKSIVDDEYPRAIKQDNNNDSDWKSKYTILDKLKQTEKEDANNTSTVGNVKYDDLSRELLMSRKDDEQTDNTGINIPVKDIKTKLAVEYTPPSRDPREYQRDEFMITQNYKHDSKEETPLAKDTNVFDTNLPSKFDDAINLYHENGTSAITNNVHQQLQSSDNDLQISPPDTTLAVAKVYNKQEEPKLHKNTGDYQDLSENDSKYEIEGTEKSHPDSKGDSNTEVIHPVELMRKTTDDTENRDNPHDMNYPIDVINVQDFTPNDNVTLIDGVNINPEGHEGNAAYYASSYQHAPETIAVEQDKNIAHQEPVTDTENVFPENTIPGEIYTEPTQQYVNPEEQDTGEVLYNEPQQYDTTTPVNTMENVLGIQAFETEQNELFYAEQPAYGQYNQGDAYNAGYTEGYVPGTYYESAGQEAYPVEINEHEETSQRYDPSYEQQYVTPVAEDAQYSEQAEYPQQTQNEQDVLVPTFMEYDQTQYTETEHTEQLGVTDQVEQQLDDEAGYYVQGAEDNTIQNIEESAPQQQTTDQTILQNVVNVMPDKGT